MKHSIILGLGTALFLVMVMGFINHQTVPTDINVRLLITSSSQNEIKFNAAYIFGEKTLKSQFGTFQTPYELSVSANNGYVAGLFSKTEGDGFLKVAVVLDKNGHTLNRLDGSGSTVVVSTFHDAINSTDTYEIKAF